MTESQTTKSSNSDSDDDVPTLSAEAQAALMEFYREQNALQQAEDSTTQQPQEDWELSQFWYSDETATKLSNEVIRAVDGKGRIACVSCPTLFIKLLDLKPDTLEIFLFEFDDRFAKYENFVRYDYREPCGFSQELSETFDLVIADPPFLSDECLTKTAVTMRRLSNKLNGGKIMLCTGAIQEDLAKRLLGVHNTHFEIQHSNKLMNQFCCFANYETLFEN